MNYFRILLVSSLWAFFFTSCGSSDTPSFGDRLSNEGGQVSEIAKQWKKGEAMIAKGEDLISSGKKMQRKGENSIEEGEDMVEKGRKLKQKAEESYSTRPPKVNLPTGTTPTQ